MIWVFIFQLPSQRLSFSRGRPGSASLENAERARPLCLSLLCHPAPRAARGPATRPRRPPFPERHRLTRDGPERAAKTPPSPWHLRSLSRNIFKPLSLYHGVNIPPLYLYITCLSSARIPAPRSRDFRLFCSLSRTLPYMK